MTTKREAPTSFDDLRDISNAKSEFSGAVDKFYDDNLTISDHPSSREVQNFQSVVEIALGLFLRRVRNTPEKIVDAQRMLERLSARFPRGGGQKFGIHQVGDPIDPVKTKEQIDQEYLDDCKRDGVAPIPCMLEK